MKTVRNFLGKIPLCEGVFVENVIGKKRGEALRSLTYKDVPFGQQGREKPSG